MNNYMNSYKSRVLRGGTSLKDVASSRMKQTFNNYMNTSLTAMYLQVTDIDEPCITSETKQLLVAVTDVTNNDSTVLDEKNLFTEVDANVGVGCYVRMDNCDWLITYQEHQAINHKKHYVMRRCNNWITLKHEDKMYRIPLSVENLTMYSDGVADKIYFSMMDSKKQMWYGNNPITRSIGETFRVILTHKTAFRVTHINDFEYNGLIKSLLLQTAILEGDDIENRYADNSKFYTFDYSEHQENMGVVENTIVGDNRFLCGEEKEFTIKLPMDKRNIEWSLTNEEDFTIKSQSDSNVVVVASYDWRRIGNKANLIVKDFKEDRVIHEITLYLTN